MNLSSLSLYLTNCYPPTSLGSGVTSFGPEPEPGVGVQPALCPGPLSFFFFLIALVRQFCDPVSWVLGAVLLVVADSESAHFRVLTNSCEHVPTF